MRAGAGGTSPVDRRRSHLERFLGTPKAGQATPTRLRFLVPHLLLAAGAIPGGEPPGSVIFWRGALAKHTAIIGSQSAGLEGVTLSRQTPGIARLADGVGRAPRLDHAGLVAETARFVPPGARKLDESILPAMSEMAESFAAFFVSSAGFLALGSFVPSLLPDVRRCNCIGGDDYSGAQTQPLTAQ